MYPDSNRMMFLFVVWALMASTEAFFLKWGSDSSRQASAQKSWVQPMSSNIPSAFRYQYSYSPYDARKMYQIQNPQYAQAEMQNMQNMQNNMQHMQNMQSMQIQQNMSPIPISMPAGASLTPVSLQHVQLVPCMCPVAPEEADKLHDQVGSGPYIAQTYAPQSYSAPQQIAVAADNTKSNKQ